MNSNPSRRVILLALLAGLVAGCGDSTPTKPDPPPNQQPNPYPPPPKKIPPGGSKLD